MRKNTSEMYVMNEDYKVANVNIHHVEMTYRCLKGAEGFLVCPIVARSSSLRSTMRGSPAEPRLSDTELV